MRRFSLTHAGTADQSISASYATVASQSLSASWAPVPVSASWASRSLNANKSDEVYMAYDFITSDPQPVLFGPFDDGGVYPDYRSVSVGTMKYIASTNTLRVTASLATNAVSSSYIPIGRSVVLCSAYTPTSTGADAAEVSIPFSPIDGTSSINWNVKRLSLRTQTAETITSSIIIQKSTVVGVFSATSIGTVLLLSGAYESYSGSLQTVSSGDKLRFNVSTLGTATNWTVITELSNA